MWENLYQGEDFEYYTQPKSSQDVILGKMCGAYSFFSALRNMRGDGVYKDILESWMKKNLNAQSISPNAIFDAINRYNLSEPWTDVKKSTYGTANQEVETKSTDEIRKLYSEYSTKYSKWSSTLRVQIDANQHYVFVTQYNKDENKLLAFDQQNPLRGEIELPIQNKSNGIAGGKTYKVDAFIVIFDKNSKR